jgi:hypothetical protein
MLPVRGSFVQVDCNRGAIGCLCNYISALHCDCTCSAEALVDVLRGRKRGTHPGGLQGCCVVEIVGRHTRVKSLDRGTWIIGANDRCRRVGGWL